VDEGDSCDGEEVTDTVLFGVLMLLDDFGTTGLTLSFK
jgi:hypothetical protein